MKLEKNGKIDGEEKCESVSFCSAKNFHFGASLVPTIPVKHTYFGTMDHGIGESLKPF